MSEEDEVIDVQAKTITVNDVKYVRADSAPVEGIDGRKYCIVRTKSAGIFAGFVSEREGQEVHMVNAMRIWYWDGAASLSQLAMEGVTSPENCKFPIAVNSIVLTDAIEIIEVTAAAMASIDGVKIWKR